MKIYLNASNQSGNLYAFGGTNEKVQMEKVAKFIEIELSKYECEVLIGTKNYIEDKAIEAKAWGADFAIALHSNAANGTASGTRGFYNRNYVVSKSMAQRLCAEIDAINPSTNKLSRIVDDYSYLDIWQFGSRGIPSILAEIAFHDNFSEAKWIVENLPSIAVAITNCFVKEFGLKFKGTGVGSATGGSIMDTETLYTVQLGAFKNKENAEALVVKAKSLGFTDAYVKSVNKTVEITPTTTIVVGSQVKIIGNAYATGQVIPTWVKNSVHVVSEISGEKALLGFPNGIRSWVLLKDIVFIK